MNKQLVNLITKKLTTQATNEELNQLKKLLEENPANQKVYTQMERIWQAKTQAPPKFDVESALTSILIHDHERSS